MSVDKVLIQFDSDIKELRKDMSKAKSDIKGVEKQAKKSSSNLTQSFKNVGAAIAAAFSVQQIIQFTRRSIELYDIQAKAEAALLQALKGREDVQRRLIRQAQDLQKVTLFGDEETIRAQAMLAKFGLLESQIKALIPLIQDYATISGQDLVSAADMVARSIGTSTNALIRYGIEIEGAAGSSERLESAVMALNDQVGGQAVAAAQAGAGALTQLQNEWGDFAETVGQDAAPALVKLVNGLKQAWEWTKATVMGTQAYVASMAGGRDVAQRWNDAQEEFGEWLRDHRGDYDGLREAGEAYIEQLNAEIRQLNRRSADGELSRIEVQNEARAIQDKKDAINAYVDEMTTAINVTADLAKETKGLSKELKAIPDVVNESKPQDVLDWEAWQKTLDAIAEEVKEWEEGLKASFEADSIEMDIMNAVVLSGTEADEVVQRLLQGYKDGMITLGQFYDLWKDRIQDINKEQEDQLIKQEAWKAASFDISRSLFGGMEDLSSQQTNKYIKDLERQLAAGEITEAEFEKMRKDRLRKAAKEQKAFSILTIVLNTAEAVMNALTSKPAAAAPALAAAAGIAGAVQLGLAMNAPLPQFAEGVIDLNGPGTATSDSILARLSKGESVITAEATRRDKGLLEAINKLETDEYINRSWVLPALQKQEAERREMFDDYRLYRTLRDGQLRSSKDIDRVVDAIQSSRRNLRHVV